MTFEEARQKSDYNFALNGIENDIEDIQNWRSTGERREHVL